MDSLFNIEDFYSVGRNGRVRCLLCPHYCNLAEGQKGACFVRQNQNQHIQLLSYNRPVFVSIEPIEKKYLFHVLPNSQTLSLGTSGCNLRCKYCINWRVSQRSVVAEDDTLTPDEVIAYASANKVKIIAFTYTEPTIYFEYMMDIALRARAAGMTVVVKSNGFMNPEVLQTLALVVDAINIDLKGWHSETYQRIIGGSLEPVLGSLKLAKQLGLWLEVTTLIVPELNTSVDDLSHMAQFIVENLGNDTPWHLLRFFPHHQMQTVPATAKHQLQQAVEIGRAMGLQYLYSGDIANDMMNTICPNCQAIVIERNGLTVINHLQNDHCPRCNTEIPGYGVAHG